MHSWSVVACMDAYRNDCGAACFSEECIGGIAPFDYQSMSCKYMLSLLIRCATDSRSKPLLIVSSGRGRYSASTYDHRPVCSIAFTASTVVHHKWMAYYSTSRQHQLPRYALRAYRHCKVGTGIPNYRNTY